MLTKLQGAPYLYSLHPYKCKLENYALLRLIYTVQSLISMRIRYGVKPLGGKNVSVNELHFQHRQLPTHGK